MDTARKVISRRQERADSFGLGDRFRAENLYLFQSCGCTRAVVPLLNRRGVDTLATTISKAANLLARKNTGVNPADVELLINNLVRVMRYEQEASE